MGDGYANRAFDGKQRQRPMPKMGCDGVRGETYSTVRTSPHLLQLELLHARLVRCDGRAFDADRVLLDGLGRIDSDLIVCLGRLVSGFVLDTVPRASA